MTAITYSPTVPGVPASRPVILGGRHDGGKVTCPDSTPVMAFKRCYCPGERTVWAVASCVPTSRTSRLCDVGTSQGASEATTGNGRFACYVVTGPRAVSCAPARVRARVPLRLKGLSL